jgi:hypothetical protein
MSLVRRPEMMKTRAHGWCPVGTSENSPAPSVLGTRSHHRASPVGTIERRPVPQFSRASSTFWSPVTPFPAMNGWAIFTRPERGEEI